VPQHLRLNKSVRCKIAATIVVVEQILPRHNGRQVQSLRMPTSCGAVQLR
jgi:hypothetical protein